MSPFSNPVETVMLQTNKRATNATPARANTKVSQIKELLEEQGRHLELPSAIL